MDSKNKLIILSGPSSAGKTTLANALQDSLVDIFLNVSDDNFIDLLPELWRDKKELADYTFFIAGDTVGVNLDSGNNVIFEGVFTPKTVKSLKDAFKDYPTYAILLNSPLGVLKNRESTRTNRSPSFLGQRDLFNNTDDFSLEIDTSKFTTEECVGIVAKHIGLEMR